MEMGMMRPSSSMDVKFDSACTSPYMSAPSSPPRFGSCFYSAPTSPTRISALDHHDFFGSDTLSVSTYANGGAGSLSAVPFDWEEKPGIPKTKLETQMISTATSSNYGDAEEVLEDTDFAFDFSGHLERCSTSADELFDGGKIKPLKPPPRFNYDHNNKPLDSPKSPRSPKKMIREAFSPRHMKKDLDPFAVALEQSRRENIQENDIRGRERIHNSLTPSNSRHKGTRSLSPYRVSDLLFDPEFSQEAAKNPSSSSSSSNSNSSLSAFSSLWYKKWRIKDYLLFRSASEGHATEKDQLKKYSVLKRTHPAEEVKNSSFRSTDSIGSVSSRRRSGPPISAHELHYTANRAVSEEMKKRTFLPYKQGLLGCLGFYPSLPDQISKGCGSTSSLSRGGNNTRHLQNTRWRPVEV